jgi:hypothetical protein
MRFNNLQSVDAFQYLTLAQLCSLTRSTGTITNKDNNGITTWFKLNYFFNLVLLIYSHEFAEVFTNVYHTFIQDKPARTDNYNKVTKKV